MEIGIDPIIFSIGSLNVGWYGVMVALAVMVGVTVPALLVKRDRIEGLTHNEILSLAVWAVPGGIIGARLIHIFDRWGYFMDHPGEIIGGEGMGIFGAIIGGTLAGLIYAKIKGFPIGQLCDTSAFGLILAQAVGRIGCLLNGCCYGTHTGLPWAATWTHPDPDIVNVHPTQLYELLFDLALFAFLWVIRKRIKPPGALYLIYISVYSIGRFFISFLRTNDGVLVGLQQSQIVSIVVLAIAVGLIVYVYRRAIPVE